MRKISVREEIKLMEKGQTAEFEPERIHTVSVTASNVGFETGRKYSVRRDRENRKVIVTRVE